MKIDARLTYYRTGGISTYITRLVDTLERLDTVNRYTVFHSRKARESLVKRFEHARLWTPSHHRLERVALSVELLRHNLDVFHTTDFIPPQFGARRHIITVHDLTFLHYPQFLTDESRRYYNDQIGYAVEHADHILTDSTASKRDMIERLSVPESKITVHLLGVARVSSPCRRKPSSIISGRWNCRIAISCSSARSAAQNIYRSGRGVPRVECLGSQRAAAGDRGAYGLEL